MQDKASAYVGGHITLLFSVQSTNNNPDLQGSRGAGICVEDGVLVNLSTQPGNGTVRVVLPAMTSGKGVASIYEEVVRQASDMFDIPVDIDWNFEVVSKLPFGQGFGCSAAGALAASVTLLYSCGYKEKVLQNAMRIAHRVERTLSSGLGDVAALTAGGVELRVHAGLPLTPAPGVVLSWEADNPVLLCWNAEKSHHTSGYIDNDDWKKSISDAGNAGVDRLVERDWTREAWASLLEEAELFAKKSGLLDDSNRVSLLAGVEELLMKNQMLDDWAARLCMLGSSVVVVPRDINKTDEGDLGYLLNALQSVELDGCITRICSVPIR